MTFNCLPNEIIIKIISQLCVYDRISCEQVCHRWQQLAHIFMAGVNAFNFGHHLRICSDSDHKVFDPRGLSNGFERVIKVLDETSFLKQILSFTPRLKCLNVYLRNGKSVDTIMKYCSDIECLTLISFEDQVMLNAISMISKFGNTLRHLKICDESRVIRRNGLEDLLAGMLSQCTRLQIFHLFRIQLNARSGEVIGHNIREICTQLGCGSIQALIRRKIFENLESLLIRESLINSSRMHIICQSFTNLKKLYIESYTDCDDFTHFPLIAQMTRLEHLEINFIPKLYNGFVCIDDQLSHIFANCKQLTKISFNNCLNVSITNECLIKMSANCTELKHIHFWRFGDMMGVGQEGIEALVSLTKLRYLTLDALNFNINQNDFELYSTKLFDLNPNLNFFYLFVNQMTRI